MTPQNREPKRIDVLELSETEKIQFLHTARMALRRSIEEVKFWRAVLESEEATVNGEPIAL
jgi:tRNA A37 threonylcarbamoyladenosine dehydratase